MIKILNIHFSTFDFDVRKTKDARFMDQKVTPDVLSIIADCVINYDADKGIEFTKDDIWKDKYFNINVKGIFNKPDVLNKTTKREYDKFTSQPLRTLAYAGILTMQKQGNKNIYKISNRQILEYIGIKERNAYFFLVHYLEKVLTDSGLLKYFKEFKNKCIKKTITKNDFQDLKVRFQKFIIGNTPINTLTEVNRIFPKILNVFSCENNIEGTIKGRLSNRQIYYTDLMYNRPNWRDINKNKNISRNEAISEYESLMVEQSVAYSEYQIQKAMSMIRKMYTQSEVTDQWSNGNATQIHHIFPKADFPQIAHYLENLIKLTATQHYTKAHPNNKTQEINREYQLICLLAKTDSIEKSLNKGEYVYRKESFMHVIRVGLSQNIDDNLSFREIKTTLTRLFNAM